MIRKICFTSLSVTTGVLFSMWLQLRDLCIMNLLFVSRWLVVNYSHSVTWEKTIIFSAMFMALPCSRLECVVSLTLVRQCILMGFPPPPSLFFLFCYLFWGMLTPELPRGQALYAYTFGLFLKHVPPPWLWGVWWPRVTLWLPTCVSQLTSEDAWQYNYIYSVAQLCMSVSSLCIWFLIQQGNLCAVQKLLLSLLLNQRNSVYPTSVRP